MRKIIYTSLIFCLFPLSFANAYTFTRSLSLGSTGDDVLELQKYLNSDPATQVSATGPGSIGNETKYFGTKTKEAVIKLQNINADAILKPYGLTQGTGYVGKSTRDFLNRSETAFSNTKDAAISTTNDKVIDQLGKSIDTIATSTISTDVFTDAIANKTLSTIKYSSSTKPLLTDIEKTILQLEKAAREGKVRTASSTSEVDRIIDQLDQQYMKTYGTSTASTITNDGFVLSPQKAKPNQRVYVGSQKDISQLSFYIGTEKMISKCHSQYTCVLRVPEDFSLKMTEITTSNPKFGSQKLEIIKDSEVRPELFVSKLSLSKENLITGKNFGSEMTVRTLYGTYTTTTKNDSFILEFPKGNTFSPGPGYIFVENKSGLHSDILTVPYEK